MRNITNYLMLALAMFFMLSCSSEDMLEENKNPWGITYSHANLGAYPDLYSKYWVYAFDITQNENVGLRITGEYPQTRFFSFSIYNDLRGEAIDGLDDIDILPDNGSVNPYKTSTTGIGNRYTIYLLKKGTDLSLFPNIKEENICYFGDEVQCVSICLRQYLGVDEFGGVGLPAVEGVSLLTGKSVKVPEPVASKATMMKEGYYEPLATDENMSVPFLLAPRGEYFPNYSTDYLYCRTRMTTDQVFTFSFIPAPVPNAVEEYETAKARYWSICIGSVVNTRSYCSFYDKMLEYPEGEKINVVVVSANNKELSAVKEAVKKIPNSYLLEWNEKTLDDQGREIGDIITVMYRNILPDKTWEYSMVNVTPTKYNNPYANVTDPDKQEAHRVIGDYGPLGTKYSTEEFLKLY